MSLPWGKDSSSGKLSALYNFILEIRIILFGNPVCGVSCLETLSASGVITAVSRRRITDRGRRARLTRLKEALSGCGGGWGGHVRASC